MIVRNCDLFPVKVIFDNGESVKLYPGREVCGGVRKVDKILSCFNKELPVPEISKTRNDLCLVNIYNEKFGVAKTLAFGLLLLIFFITVNEPTKNAMSLGVFSLVVFTLTLSVYFVNGLWPQLTFIANMEYNTKIIRNMSGRYGFFDKAKYRLYWSIFCLLLMLSTLILKVLKIDFMNHLIEIACYGAFIPALMIGLCPVCLINFQAKRMIRHYHQDAYYTFLMGQKYLYPIMGLSVIMWYHFVVFLDTSRHW